MDDPAAGAGGHGASIPPARRLAAALEPFVGQVYFAPECHAAYQALGFGPSPGTTSGGVALPDGPAYFCSRGSVMGQVPGEVIAAAFGVFDPEVVVLAVAHGWSLTDAPTICAARSRGAVGQLGRILGPAPDGVERVVELLERAVSPLQPAGKPLFAGIRSCPVERDPLARAWQLGDALREYRGDAHVAAWTAAGLDGAEIGLLTEPFWGLPLRSYVRTRAWSAEQLDRAEAGLRERGLLDGDALSAEGRAVREGIEEATDRQCAPTVAALGPDLDELVERLTPWGVVIRDAGGYLPRGPHELAR